MPNDEQTSVKEALARWFQFVDDGTKELLRDAGPDDFIIYPIDEEFPLPQPYPEMQVSVTLTYADYTKPVED